MTTTPTTKPTPIPYAETTSWSPCHIGRAQALTEATPGMYRRCDFDENGKPTRLVDTGESADVYGSDLGGHLDMLAAREREHATPRKEAKR